MSRNADRETFGILLTHLGFAKVGRPVWWLREGYWLHNR